MRNGSSLCGRIDGFHLTQSTEGSDPRAGAEGGGGSEWGRGVVGIVDVLHQNESTVNTNKEIADECVEEASIIRSEIERLKTQRATLRDMIEYVEVVDV